MRPVLAVGVVLLLTSGPVVRTQAEEPLWEPITSEHWAEDGSGFGEPAAVLVFEKVFADDTDFENDRCVLRVVQRFKVLRVTDGVGEFELPFHEDLNSIETLRARTVHPDGRVFEVADEDILAGLAVSTTEGAILKRTLTMPGVQPGVLIDVQVEYANKEPNTTWEIQRDIPLRFGEYRWRPWVPAVSGILGRLLAEELTTPNYVWVNPPENPELYGFESKVLDGGGGIEAVFTIRDIPGLRPSVLSLPGTRLETLLLVYYGSFSSDELYWSTLAEGTRDWLDHSADEYEALDEWAREIISYPTRREKISAAFYLLTERIQPDDRVYARRGHRAEIDIKRAVRTGRATSMEMSLCLWHLLRRAGVPVGLAFVRDRRTGVLIREAKFWQFNAVFVVASDDQRRHVYCAPGERGAYPGWLPWYLEGLEAFFIDRREAGLRELGTGDPEDNESTVEITLEMSGADVLEGEFEWTRTGNYARAVRETAVGLDAAAREELARSELRERFPNARFENIELRNWGARNLRTSLEIRARVVVRGRIGHHGSRAFLRPLALLVEESDPLGDLLNEHPIAIPFPYTETLVARIRPREGMSLQLLPPSETKDGFAGFVQTRFLQDGTDIEARRTFRINHTYFEVKYVDLVEDLFDRKQRAQDMVVVLSEP